MFVRCFSKRSENYSQCFSLFSKSCKFERHPSLKHLNVFPFRHHEKIIVTIGDLTNLGSGIGRKMLDCGSEWVIMVPKVLPGETVKVRINKNHSSYSEGDLIEVLSESPDRVKPQCQFFNDCGGCQYQHMNISAQRRWKQSQVVNVLQRIGQLYDMKVNEVVGDDTHYGYRSKLTPHYNKPMKHLNKTIDMPIGFLQRGTKTIVDISDCIIATDNVRESYRKTRADLKFKMNSGQRIMNGATLLFRESDNGHVATDFRKSVIQTVCGISFRYKAGEFFQTNLTILPVMIQHVIKLATRKNQSKQHITNNSDCKYLIDAYCGSGLFALTAASHFTNVYGVEISHLAVEAATENAMRNNIKNAQFMCGSSEDIFSKVKHLPRDETVVIIDPPRKGCDQSFLTQLFLFRPKRIVYVSCDPATQARDAKAIVAAGYTVTDVTPFDLFPQTRHIENIMAFERLSDAT